MISVITPANGFGCHVPTGHSALHCSRHPPPACLSPTPSRRSDPRSLAPNGLARLTACVREPRYPHSRFRVRSASLLCSSRVCHATRKTPHEAEGAFVSGRWPERGGPPIGYRVHGGHLVRSSTVRTVSVPRPVHVQHFIDKGTGTAFPRLVCDCTARRHPKWDSCREAPPGLPD